MHAILKNGSHRFQPDKIPAIKAGGQQLHGLTSGNRARHPAHRRLIMEIAYLVCGESQEDGREMFGGN